MSQDSFLVDPKTGQKFPIGGCLISDKPSDAPKYGAMRRIPTQNLPPEADLRPLMTPVEQQLNTQACVGNALAGAYEFLIMKNIRKHVDVSRLFIYYNGRRIDNPYSQLVQDGGTHISSAIKGLAQYGCCKEDMFPYTTANINRQPSALCYAEAKKYRIASSMSIETNLDEMKACLAEGYPFVFGLQLFQSFTQAGSNHGRVPMPQYYEQQAAQHGWHALLAVGYNEPSRCFIVRNSWGDDWGDKGYCYIPYDYMRNPNNCRDLHAIKAVTGENRRDSPRNVVNTYVWNKDKDKNNAITQDYPYPNFDHTFFWRYKDVFNYFNSFFQNGHVVPFVWASPGSEDSSEQRKPSSSKKRILWIDIKHEENSYVESKLLAADKSFQMDFCETMGKAQNYLQSNKDSLRSLPTIYIVCRGFYKDENKNPLNLLDCLLTNRLSNAKVAVFTRDRNGVEYHLDKQASTFHISDWRRRLAICVDVGELIENITESFDITPSSNKQNRFSS